MIYKGRLLRSFLYFSFFISRRDQSRLGLRFLAPCLTGDHNFALPIVLFFRCPRQEIIVCLELATQKTARSITHSIGPVRGSASHPFYQTGSFSVSLMYFPILVCVCLYCAVKFVQNYTFPFASVCPTSIYRYLSILEFDYLYSYLTSLKLLMSCAR